MNVFRKRTPSNLIPINPDNTASKDWVVLLEAGTIVGPSPVRLRVARSTREKKIVKRYGPLLNVKHFLELEGYDPRIHAVYFCPQLFRYDPDNKLVPLEGEEIGEIVAHTLVSGVLERRPWYEPSEKIPSQPIINTPSDNLKLLLLKCPVREPRPTRSQWWWSKTGISRFFYFKKEAPVVGQSCSRRTRRDRLRPT